MPVIFATSANECANRNAVALGCLSGARFDIGLPSVYPRPESVSGIRRQLPTSVGM
jgi:hypothetical protein